MSGGRPVRSLGRTLSRWLAWQSLAGLVLVCSMVYGATWLGFEARQRDELEQKQAQLRHLLAEAPTGASAAALVHKLDDFFVGHPGLGLVLRRPDGSSFYERRAAQTGAVRIARFDAGAASAMREPLRADLVLDVGNDARLLRRIGLTLALAALAGAALAAAGGFWLVRLGLAPLRGLVDQTRRLAADTLHQRLDGSAQPEELAPLIAQFNELLARLERAYEQLEGFNADVAHELCTPLTTLIGSSELALRRTRDAATLRDVLGSNLDETRRLADIVHDMLFLSRADRGAQARRGAPISLAALANQVARYHEAALAEAGLTLEVDGDAQARVDAPLVQRALSNLLDNAARHATRDSRVQVAISRLPSGEVSVTIANHGATLQAPQLPRLFDRFYRADPSRSGSGRHHGLGLAIVAAISRMHGGRPLARSADGLTHIGFTLAGPR